VTRPLLLLVTILSAETAIAQTKPQAMPVFGVDVENVLVDAFVSQKGVPVKGLSASDFELKDNGVVQRLELVSADMRPLQVLLVFDTSNSLDATRLSALRAASEALLAALRPQDEASLFTFSDDVSWAVKPTTDKGSIARSLSAVRPGGSTSAMDALYAALVLPNAPGRTLLVLFTDGVDNTSFLDWKQVQVVAERSNALIHLVSLKPPAITAPGETTEMGIRSVSTQAAITLEFEGPWAFRQIAEATGGRYWEAESLDRVRAAFAAIAELMGERYVLRYAPEGSARPGWHTLELKLRGKRGEVRTRKGYWVSPPAPEARLKPS
jgi:VWFA-related protein